MNYGDFNGMPHWGPNPRGSRRPDVIDPINHGYMNNFPPSPYHDMRKQWSGRWVTKRVRGVQTHHMQPVPPNTNSVDFNANTQAPKRLHDSSVSHDDHEGVSVTNKRRFVSQSSLPININKGSHPTSTTVTSSTTFSPDDLLKKSHLVEVKNLQHKLQNGSKWDQLSQEIWDTFVTHQQSEKIYTKKVTLLKWLSESVKSIDSRYSVYIVGSTISGFGTDHSDMDVCLLTNDRKFEAMKLISRYEAICCLTKISDLLKRKDNSIFTEVIRAKVPILKFRDVKNSVEVDLNCNNYVGIRNTHLLYCYSQLDWRVRPLVLMVKIWANHHDINDAKNMTISSYSLVLMVIHYLQCGTRPAVLPCLQKEMPHKFNADRNIFDIGVMEEMKPYPSQNKQTLGELMYGFFKYFSEFNYMGLAISIRTGSSLNKTFCQRQSNEPREWKNLCIEEPFDKSNTARSVHNPIVFYKIVAVFKATFAHLVESPSKSSLLFQ